MAEDETIWHTTVDETIRIFRGALIALLPTLERARIAWRDIDSYDGWDHICQTLFDEIVFEPCRWATGDLELSLPKYDLPQHSYDDRSFITTRRANDEDDALVFLSLDPNHDDFASAKFTTVTNGAFSWIPVEECSFELSHLSSDGLRRPVRDLVVQL